MTSTSEESLHDAIVARPVPGPGLVARFGNVVFVATATGSQTLGLQHLLHECGGAAGADGRKLVRQLAGWLSAQEPDDVPSFALAAPTSSGLALMLHGDGEAAVTSAGTTNRLSGRDSAAWVDRLLAWPVEELVISCGKQEDLPVDPLLDLRSGVVPGAGLVVRWAKEMASAQADETVAAPEMPVAAPEMPVPAPEIPVPAPEITPETTMVRPAAPAFESVLLIEPEAEAADDAEPADRADVVVKGINCKRGHFNDPAAAFCGVCGISMVQQTHQLVDGVRPPLGVVVLDDGTTFTVDDDYVLGREPELDPRVQDGTARPLVLADAEGTVSRSHALLALVGWDVELTDLGSSNGTYITLPNASGSTPLPRHHPVKIAPGTRIVMGSRTLVFDSHVKI